MASKICFYSISFVFIFFMATPMSGWAQKIDPATYYKGKTIELIVPVSAGGGSDITARFLTDWFNRFIPGNPGIIVRLMPGANNLIGSNYVYNVAKKDGLTILVGSSVTNINSLLQLKGCKYDLNKMPLVMAVPSGQIFYIRANVIKTFKDIFEKEVVIFGHQPAGGGNATGFILAKEVLGFKTQKIILVYQGSGDARRAFLSGESNATGDTVQVYEASIQPLEKTGDIKYLFQSGTLDTAGNVIRVDPPVGHIPTVYDRYVEIYGKPPSGNIWEAYKTFLGVVSVFEKTLTFPPGTPSEIVNIVGEACNKLVKDPKFIADADAKLRSQPIAGAEMQKIYENSMIRANPEAINWLKTWLREKWGVE